MIHDRKFATKCIIVPVDYLKFTILLVSEFWTPKEDYITFTIYIYVFIEDCILRKLIDVKYVFH